ncbi:MAG: hypothetical protein H7233_16500 [Pseudorhodobacter sp.]|nr:hypothetical protein [Frankiaceae bacterium]
MPGSVVRGAFAAAWIARYGIPGGSGRERFIELFEGGVRFGPLFAAGPPAPLSLVVHKYGHTPACLQAEWDRAAGQTPPPACPDCGRALEASKGALPEPPRTRTAAHVALTDKETAADGKLFDRDVVAKGSGSGSASASGSGSTSFDGAVDGPPELLRQLQELTRLRIGGRRTTTGAVAPSWQDDPAPAAPELLASGQVVLRLAAPGVLVDDLGRPSRSPSLGELERALGTSVTVAQAWTRWGTDSGWHAASGLPKPVETVVAAGSTYLLQPASPVTAQALAALGERGIGLRRHEGYGALAPPPVPKTTAGAARARAAAVRDRAKKDFGAFGLGLFATACSAALRQRVAAELRDVATRRRVEPGATPPPESVLVKVLTSPEGAGPFPLVRPLTLVLATEDPDLLEAYAELCEKGYQP